MAKRKKPLDMQNPEDQEKLQASKAALKNIGMNRPGRADNSVGDIWEEVPGEPLPPKTIEFSKVQIPTMEMEKKIVEAAVAQESVPMTQAEPEPPADPTLELTKAMPSLTEVPTKPNRRARTRALTVPLSKPQVTRTMELSQPEAVSQNQTEERTAVLPQPVIAENNSHNRMDRPSFSDAPLPESFPPQASEPPARKQRRTMVQEFDMPRLEGQVAQVAQSLEPPTNELATAMQSFEQPEESTAAMEYFKGAAGGQTYTAELRFRAQFSSKETHLPQVAAAPVSEQVDEEWLSVDITTDSGTFAPSLEPARIAGTGQAPVNMLDLIDQGYRAIPVVPQGFTPQRQVEVEVDYSQASAKLPPPASGLAGGLGAGTKGGGGRSKNRWSKK